MRKLSRIVLMMIISFVCMSLSAISQNKIIVHADQPGSKIEKAIYGHFAEHLGHCIYGGFWVGETSSIPNVRGIRSDVVAALKDMNIPVLRWPGGCFADTYHWKDGIGPREKRPSIINVNWGGVTEDNSFGTHEFMDLCEQLGCDAYISGNVGSGTVQEMTEWVEYMTSDVESPMTKLRKQNGREKPWKVKYLGIGNEAWGCGGSMTPEFYSNLCRQYGTYINSACPSLTKIASGASESDLNWTDVVMKNVGNRIQDVSLHYYTLPGDWSLKGSATDFTINDWFTVLRKTLVMDTLINKHLSVMDKYDKKIGLMVDEWGTWYDVEPGTNPGFLFQQNTLRDALVAGINLNIFNNHADRVKMANIAQVINVLQSVILTKGSEMVLTPTYFIFKMYKVHQDAKMLPIEIKCNRYTSGTESVDAINASASMKDGVVSITLCNLDPINSQAISFDVQGLKIESVSGQIVTANKINAFNDFGKKEEVTLADFKNAKLNKGQVEATIPAKSVVLIQLK